MIPTGSSISYEVVPYQIEYRAHVASLVLLLDEWFEPDAWSDIDEELGPDTTLIAVDQDDDVIGFVVVKLTGDNAGRITWAGVDPSYHRMGVGKALIESVIREATDAGLDALYVETMSDNVEYEPFARTRAFYAALGFQAYLELGDTAGNGLATTDWVLDLVGQPV